MSNGMIEELSQVKVSDTGPLYVYRVEIQGYGSFLLNRDLDRVECVMATYNKYYVRWVHSTRLYTLEFECKSFEVAKAVYERIAGLVPISDGYQSQ